MDPRGFCSQTRVVIVAGKGGVGKTTVSAALARTAARSGLSTLVVEVEGKRGVAPVFGVPPLEYQEQVIVPAGPEGVAEIRARTLAPDEALVDYLDEHGMGRLSRRLVRSGALEVVSTATPGIKDVLILGKVKQLERQNAADLIVVDAPAAGHAVTFLTSARGLLDAMRVGPVRAQAQDVLDLLTDPSRCQVMLVTLPEETPVNEAAETAFTLEDRVGVSLGPIVVNGLYPVMEGLGGDPRDAAREAGEALPDEEVSALGDAATLRLRRQELQRGQVERLRQALPLPQLHLQFVFAPDIGPGEIDQLATALEEQVRALPEPAEWAVGPG